MNQSENIFSARALLIEHPGVFLTVIYAAASIIGLVYTWAFLNAFGINVFHYAELTDFMLASLKEPFTWILTLFAVSLTALDNTLSSLVQKRKVNRFFKWYGNPRYRQINILLLCMLVVSFLLVYARDNAEIVRQGENPSITVYLSDGSEPKSRVLLGTTGKFIFFYDKASQQIDIHPHESVLMLTQSSIPAKQS